MKETKKEYKTFADLVFNDRDAFIGDYAIQAKMYFNNGYGVSVIQGPMTYGQKAFNTYELAVLKYGHLCYTTPITDNVLGYLSPEEVTEKMREIQDLPEENEDKFYLLMKQELTRVKAMVIKVKSIDEAIDLMKEYEYQEMVPFSINTDEQILTHSHISTL